MKGATLGRGEYLVIEGNKETSDFRRPADWLLLAAITMDPADTYRFRSQIVAGRFRSFRASSLGIIARTAADIVDNRKKEVVREIERTDNSRVLPSERRLNQSGTYRQLHRQWLQLNRVAERNSTPLGSLGMINPNLKNLAPVLRHCKQQGIPFRRLPDPRKIGQAYLKQLRWRPE